MRDLIAQECFEIEALDRLNSARLLGRLVFVGGTMLRLCYGLNRYSVDLDFWTAGELDPAPFAQAMTACLSEKYAVRDATDKRFSMVFEIKSPRYPRSLKIEIRKKDTIPATQQAIAYSRHSATQVLLTTLALPEMMQTKISAFLDRGEIRDVFDIEFLFKRGIPLRAEADILKKVLRGIDKLKKKDYTVKLGALLEEQERQYYTSENFKLLRQEIIALLRTHKEC